MLVNKNIHKYWFYETPELNPSIYNLWWTLKEVQFLRKIHFACQNLENIFEKEQQIFTTNSLSWASIIVTCNVYLTVRIQHFEGFLWFRLKNVEMQEANGPQIRGGCRICNNALAEAATSKEFTVSVNPSQDFDRGNRQDATEFQFFNIAHLMVGPLVTYVGHVTGTGWCLHRRETMSWPVLVQSGKQMRNTGCEARTVRGMIESFPTEILQQVPSLWLRVHCQRGEFLLRQKTETF